MNSHPETNPPTITARELREKLAELPANDRIIFAGGLRLTQIKTRGAGLWQMEFMPHVYATADGAWKVSPPEWRETAD